MTDAGAVPSGAADPGEAEYLASYDAHAFPPFAVTVDIVMLTIRQGALSVLLVERGDHPFKGRLALPGGFVGQEEDLEAAAAREVVEETGLDHPLGHLEQLGTWGAARRDPRMRVVDVAYLALLPGLPDPVAGSDAAGARWWRVDDVEDDMLAFDHAEILAAGVERARSKLEYTPLATAFTDDTFTLRELQAVYEAVWGVRLHRPNFRRKVLSAPDFVVAVDDTRPSPRGRAGRLYRAGEARLLHPAILRPGPDDATDDD